jgi:hypothetical protein
MHTTTVEELFRQAQQLPPDERRRLAHLLLAPPDARPLGEQLRTARARIVASGVPLLDEPGVAAEVAERRGD